MLNTPASFPENGSWALFARCGEIVAARITALSGDRRTASISFPDRPTASGARDVLLDKLLDPTPLSAEEAHELRDLERHLGALAHPQKSTRYARYEELRSRGPRARQLVDLLDRLNRTRLATPASREAARTFAAAIEAGELRAAA